MICLKSGIVTLKIFDALGREVKTLVDNFEDAGRKEVIWNGTNNFGKNVSSGIYFYRITAHENVNVKKMIMLR